uniref:GATA zinc finger domain-containing protein n=1 Tax=Mycena chlorophos TaxID=658473 RepID=A0ABQ0LKL6_MYCCL|nr:GATA zinc finger domain-containing protein [Mycena chlorophos]
MALEALFAPLPALVDREEHHARPLSSSSAGRLSLNLGLRYSGWADDVSSASSYTPSSYGPSPTSSGSASPLAFTLDPPVPITATSTAAAAIGLPPPVNYNAESPAPSIDLSSLIPFDSFGVGDAFGANVDDWTFPGLPAFDWSDFSNASLFPSSPYPSSSATSSGAASPSSYFLSPQLTPATIPTAASPVPSSAARQKAPRALNPDGTAAKKECFHCHATSTPLWRREPVTQRPLCNACGLYLQQRNKLRPQELIDADRDDSDDEINRIPDSEYTGPRCSHCNTRQTSVWRRNKDGKQVCNACGVYQRLRGKERPLSLKRNKIKPRTKHNKP